MAVYDNSKYLNYNFLKSNLPLVIKTNHGSGDFALIKNKYDINLMKLKLFLEMLKRNLDIEKNSINIVELKKKYLLKKCYLMITSQFHLILKFIVLMVSLNLFM